MTELKSCPFCESDHIMISYHHSFEPTIASVYVARCGSCKVRTNIFYTEGNAIKAWNTRSSDKSLEKKDE